MTLPEMAELREDADLLMSPGLELPSLHARRIGERIIALLDGYEARGKEVERLLARERFLIDACSKTEDEVQQIIGKALGYPWFKDDQLNFPGAIEANGVCVAASLAIEVVAALRKSEERAAELEKALVPFGEVGDWMVRNGHTHDSVHWLVRNSDGEFLGYGLAQGSDFLKARATLTKDTATHG
jgi:hypothetical protein